MAEMKKETTPPPLLLMAPSGGLTLNPPEQSDTLMPIIQSEASLLPPDEDAEVDRFIGQSPPKPTFGQPEMFPATLQQTNQVDPFQHVGQGVQSSSGPRHPMSGEPLTGGATGAMGNNSMAFQPPPQPNNVTSSAFMPPPPQAKTGPNENMFRRQGPSRYAQPPPGHYADLSSTPMSNVYTPAQPPTNIQHTTMPPPPPPHVPPSFQPPGVSRPPQNISAPSFDDVQPRRQFDTQTMADPTTGIYQPVQYHWCYCKKVENRDIWFPFSILDSLKLEEAYHSGITVVATDGGRYDVNVNERTKYAVYWEERPSIVRRCSWFFKRDVDNRYVPYEEEFSNKLELEYKNAIQSNTWHKRLEFQGGETIVMHNPNVIVHFQSSNQPDEWGTVQSVYTLPGDQMRPKVVRRGVEDFEQIDDGETSQIDHLVFIVHGIGAFCDVKFRSIVECVDDFRSISINLQKSHFHTHLEQGKMGRVEFLPVHWHKALHSDATGVDKRLKAITLPSTAKLRHFINDTLLDILFYTSPTYCQCIADTIGQEMNRLFQLFLSRCPGFNGTVSVSGHSLGSSVLFDLLLHQRECNTAEKPADFQAEGSASPPTTSDYDEQSPDSNIVEETELSLEELLAKVGLQDKADLFHEEQIDIEALVMCSESDLKDLGVPMGPRKKLQGLLKEEQNKKAKKAEADEKKKQIAEQKMQAELERQDKEKRTPERVVKKVSSISVDYICGLAGTGQPSVQYPQLDFQPAALFALGSPIALFLSVRGVENVGADFRLPTCPRVFNIFHPFDPVAYRLEPLINQEASTCKPVLMPHHKGRKRLHLELKESLTRVGADIKQKIIESFRSTWNSINEFARSHKTTAPSLEQEVDNVLTEMQQCNDDTSETASIASQDDDLIIGQLNEGRRIDYVLQEKPIESFNDYLFALASHGCYWESEDTVLMVLKEIYSPFGITPQMPGPDSSQKASRLFNPPAPSIFPTNTSSVPPPNIAVPTTSTYFKPGQPSVSSAQHTQSVPTGMGPNFSQPPNVNQAAPVGPPPMSGFIRKTPK